MQAEAEAEKENRGPKVLKLATTSSTPSASQLHKVLQHSGPLAGARPQGAHAHLANSTMLSASATAHQVQQASKATSIHSSC